MEAHPAEQLLTVKRLAPSEYDSLRAVEEGYVPDPDHSIAIVGASGEEIVGRVLLIRPFHIEGTWISERFRRGTLGIRLFRLLEKEAGNIGLKKLFSYAQSPEIEDYLKRMGYEKLDVTVWAKEICR